jgi:nicotinamidase-related amidase
MAGLAGLAVGRKPALLVVDVQRDFGDPSRLGGYGLTASAVTALSAAVDRIGELVSAARELRVPVVWIELGSDPASPWRSSNWLRSGDYEAPLSPDEPCITGTPGASWYRMEPASDEVRVVKRRYSGFLGTDLDARLGALGCDWLTITGLTSECCVAATAMDAMQLDWRVVIPRDATAAYDLDVHSAALVALSLNVAMLSSSSEVLALWKQVSG